MLIWSGTEEVITAWTRNPSCEQSPVGSNPTHSAKKALANASAFSILSKTIFTIYQKPFGIRFRTIPRRMLYIIDKIRNVIYNRL